MILVKTAASGVMGRGHKKDPRLIHIMSSQNRYFKLCSKIGSQLSWFNTGIKSLINSQKLIAGDQMLFSNPDGKIIKSAYLYRPNFNTMAIARTANPALNKNTFTTLRTSADGHTMTLSGTVNKIFILLLLVVAGAIYTWRLAFEAINTDSLTASRAIIPWMIGGGIGGFIVAIITVFKRNIAPVTAPIYAVLEGLFLGGISAFLEYQYPGIVINAVGLTFGILFSLLVAYRSGLIKPTENFKLGVFAATGGVAVFYLLSFLFGLFGMPVGYLHNSSLFSIGISVVIIIIAALNLVLDFDFIEQGAASSVPKYMEWYAAFGLIVTLVWLYLEILRLLSKLASRN
jgi:uncharacterized YccA/Bax inhibitor family protein